MLACTNFFSSCPARPDKRQQDKDKIPSFIDRLPSHQCGICEDHCTNVHRSNTQQVTQTKKTQGRGQNTNETHLQMALRKNEKINARARKTSEDPYIVCVVLSCCRVVVFHVFSPARKREGREPPSTGRSRRTQACEPCNRRAPPSAPTLPPESWRRC